MRFTLSSSFLRHCEARTLANQANEESMTHSTASEEDRQAIAAFTSKLRKDLQKLPKEKSESLQVAIDCLIDVYDLKEGELKAASTAELRVIQRELDVAERQAAEEYKKKGNELMQVGDLNKAMEAYTEAINLDSSNAVYWANRAAARASLGNHLDALDDATQAATLDPKYVKAHTRMAASLIALDRHEEAIQAYEKACKLEPMNKELHSMLATAKSKSKPAQAPVGSGDIDLASFLKDPKAREMASQMIGSENLKNLMNNPQARQMLEGMLRGMTNNGGSNRRQ